MKLFLLKILLQRPAKDEGFTLPMVIALGLVMLLLGAINITIANEENLTAISQNSRSDALAIAEVGVARFRELLDRNRTLAVYDSDQWATTTTTEVCDDNISSFLPGVSNNITEAGKDLNNDGDTTDVIGSYSLVSYDYTNANNTSVNGVLNLTDDAANNSAKGVLTVKGKAPNDSGEAQIQVEIPIRINPGDMTNLAPALWIGSNTISAGDLGNLTISDGNATTTNDGNVVIQDLPVATRDGCRNFAEDPSTDDDSPNLATANRSVVSDSRSIPSIQPILNDVDNARNVTNADGTTEDQTNDLPPIVSGEIKFGTRSDKPYNPDVAPADFKLPNSATGERGTCDSIRDCRYYYDPPNSATAYTNTYTDAGTDKNADLLTDGIAKTTLLLNQPLTIEATSEDVKIGSTSPVVNNSDAFEIYVNGVNDIEINASSGRTITINGFIHAPQSKLTITGAGTVNINGSVWVNDFENNNTGIVNILPDSIRKDAATPDKAYKYYTTTDNRTPRPLTGSPTDWKTQQVD